MHNIDKVLSALANKTRRDAMRLIHAKGEHCLCNLMEQLDVPQSNMSRHMRTLKLAGLVEDERRAQWVHFRLASNLPSPIKALLEAVISAPDPDRASPVPQKGAEQDKVQQRKGEAA